jgi:diguanylate cyclase (GGDEF)-like protein
MDRFKAINDTYGHQSGDQAIIETATRISGVMRNYDICARWGGDEFIILVGDVTRSTLSLMANKVLLVVSATPLHLSDGRMLDLSVTIGGCLISNEDLLADAAAKADAALYKAKRMGRNSYLVEDDDMAGAGRDAG